MHYALTHGQPVNSLLHGCLPLHAACSGGSLSVVRMLIERGADVNAPRLPRRYSEGKRSNAVPAVGTVGECCLLPISRRLPLTPGSTPLHFAAANGHASIVQVLLACGAVPNKPDKNGMTPEDLADLSNYDEVVRAIQVWSHLNGSQRNSEAISEASSGPSRPRADSMTSNLTVGSDVSDSASRKGKERAVGMVSAASEKARLLRNSFGNGLRQRAAPMSNLNSSGSSIQLATGSSGRSSPSRPPDLDLSTSTANSGNHSPELPSPFEPSPTSPVPLEEKPPHTPDSSDTSPSLTGPSPSYPRSSRRPSLPSILERAAHPGATFRQAMRKTENDSSSSITEGEHQSAYHRGRKPESNTKVNKNALLNIFRRGQDATSRSPSPPQKVEPSAVPDQLEQGIARLKRASMDPEMMQMAMDVAQLGDQLEAAAAISAPATKTRFFEDQPESQNLSPPRDRRRGTAVMSPSPLSNEWVDDERVTVRRTRTEIRQPRNVPRRIPSAPSIAHAKRRSMTLPSQYSSPLARTVQTPTGSSSNVDSPVPGSSEGSSGGDGEVGLERDDPLAAVGAGERQEGLEAAEAVSGSPARSVAELPQAPGTPPTETLDPELSKKLSRTSIGSGHPDRLSRASSRRSSRPLHRKISSHAEAHEALKQDEADVLELAQMPASEDSSRSLADQLAAYGESHALAAEFARHEQIGSISSSSGYRTSTSGSELSAPSKRSSTTSSRPDPTSPKLHLSSMDPSINKIYDRRAAAYRSQMQTLTPSIHGLQQQASTRMRASSFGTSGRHRATSASDNWLNPRPIGTPSARRLTDPSSSLPQMTPLDVGVDHHPHISNPMPVVSDLSKPAKRSTVARLQPSTGPKLQPVATSLLPARTASMNRGTADRPTGSAVSDRYRGLAQARSYAAHHGILSDRYGSRPGDGEESDDEASRSYTLVDNGLGLPVREKKWSIKAVKGAIGHFRR